MLTRLLIFAIVFQLIALQPVFARNFDCSVVYDEFDQLMMANFLQEPNRYVNTLVGMITRNEFLGLQIGKFKLREERKNAGIGTFRTNTNLYGKMIYFWQDNAWEERTPFVIDELILFGRVIDGYAPVRSSAIYLTPGMGVDLDSSRVVPVDDKTADLVYEQEGVEYRIRAVQPANVFFPVESMCAKGVDPAVPLNVEEEVSEQPDTVPENTPSEN